MKRLLLSCAVLILLTGAAAPAAATAVAGAPAVNPCWKTTVSVPERQDDSSRWTYEHTVEWCGTGTTVTRISIDGEFVVENAEECEPAGAPEISRDRDPATPALETFSMGTLICEGETAEPLQVCPWVIVAVAGDGQQGEPATGIALKAA